MQPLTPPTADVLDRLDRFLGPALLAIPPGRERRLAATYVRGLLGPSERKNAERIARQARGVERAPAFERDLTEMMASDLWRHEAVMGEASARLLATSSGWQAYTLDDTALLKQGDQSVGVSNQYAGCIGGLANCQSLVTLGVAQEHASAPLAMSLYLPPRWDADAVRRARCHVPEDVHSRPKWRMGQELLLAMEAEGLPPLPVLADSAYGDVTEFRRWLQERDRLYVVGASMTLTVWAEGTTFRARTSPPGAGRPATRLQPTSPCKPLRLDAFAATLPEARWMQVEWRHGSRGVQRARFAAVRVRPAWGWSGSGVHPEDLCAEEWLLLHWPEGESKPTKAWLSNLPAETPLAVLVALARLRWRIERDYREGKGLVGLDHFEGRSWQGLHHHAALVVLAQHFLVHERLAALHEAPVPPALPPAPAKAPPAASAAFSP